MVLEWLWLVILEMVHRNRNRNPHNPVKVLEWLASSFVVLEWLASLFVILEWMASSFLVLEWLWLVVLEMVFQF